MELADQITICQPIPAVEVMTSSANTSLSSSHTSTQQPQCVIEVFGLEHGDIIKEAKLFQDMVIEYQIAYHSLEDRYTQQVCLMKESSGALQASESQASTMQQELIALKRSHGTDIQKAVSNTVSQYKQQLNSAQSCTCDHQLAISQLQDQVCVLHLSLTSWGDLPSVGAAQGEVDLWEKVFNFVPGMVNTNRGAAMYNSPNQPFPFHKQV